MVLCILENRIHIITIVLPQYQVSINSFAQEKARYSVKHLLDTDR